MFFFSPEQNKSHFIYVIELILIKWPDKNIEENSRGKFTWSISLYSSHPKHFPLPAQPATVYNDRWKWKKTSSIDVIESEIIRKLKIQILLKCIEHWEWTYVLPHQFPHCFDYCAEAVNWKKKTRRNDARVRVPIWYWLKKKNGLASLALFLKSHLRMNGSTVFNCTSIVIVIPLMNDAMRDDDVRDTLSGNENYHNSWN